MANKKDAYLGLSAMIRAKEPKLLSRERAERMLEAASFEEAAKQLTDCGYVDMSAMNANEIDKALSKHRSAVLAELEPFAPDKGVVDVFRMKYDYHNAKAIIKAEAMGLDAEYLMSDCGRLAPEKLLLDYQEERFVELPSRLGAAMAEAKSTLARTANPQYADFVLDTAYFAEMLDAAKAADDSFLQEYIEVLIHSTNLKSAVRTLRMRKDTEFLRAVLIPGGRMDVNAIVAAGDKDGIAAKFGTGIFKKAASLGADAVDGGSMTAFELACDNAVSEFLSSAKIVGYGSETLIAYIAALEGEITAARMILTGRLSGIPSETIRERLRDFNA